MTPRVATAASLVALLWFFLINGFDVDGAPNSLACPRPPFASACDATCADRTDCDSPQEEMCCPTACGGMSCQRPIVFSRTDDDTTNRTSPTSVTQTSNQTEAVEEIVVSPSPTPNSSSPAT